MLILIALGAAPSNVARVISGTADILPHNLTVVQWADEWQCHLGASGAHNERNCAVLAMAHVLSTSAPLWAASLALHIIGRTMCCVTSRAGCCWRFAIHCSRQCVCIGLPLLICTILAADRSCAASNVAYLPSWAPRLCNMTHAPHFDSWAGLAGGIASSGTAARDGDGLPLAIYGTPFALAVTLSLVALLFGPATCAIERVHTYHLRLQQTQNGVHNVVPPSPRRGLEPLCASFAFFALSVPVWLLPLARAASQLWMERPPLASEALPWLGVTSSTLHPCVGALAVLCWTCGARRAGRAAIASGAETAASASHGAVSMEDARTGLLNAQPMTSSGSMVRASTNAHGGQNGSGGRGGGGSGSGSGGGSGGGSGSSSGGRSSGGSGGSTCGFAGSSRGEPATRPPLLLIARQPQTHSQEESDHRRNSQPASHSAIVPFSADCGAPAPASLSPPPAPSLRVPEHKAGWLYKEGHMSRGWKRRWCVVEQGCSNTLSRSTARSRRRSASYRCRVRRSGSPRSREAAGSAWAALRLGRHGV